MTKYKKLAFLIHDMNTWGGQDRSTLEIAKRLSHVWPVEIYSFTLDDPDFHNNKKNWGQVEFFPILPHIKRPLLLKATIYYIKTLLPSFKYTLLHATGACALKSDIVHVQFVHKAWNAFNYKSSMYQKIMQFYNVFFEKKTFTQKKQYIAISNSVKTDLTKHYDLEHQVQVIHHGVDPNIFKPATEEFEKKRIHEIRTKYNIAQEDSLVLLVGSYERKGLSNAIEAISLLPDEIKKNTKLMAVGGGDNNKYLSEAKSFNIFENLILVESQKDIFRFFQAADLFLLPTRYETFGLVILEAMACGLPCIVSELAGGAELIEDSVNGYKIKNPKDSNEISRLLEKLLENKDLQTKISENSRKTAENRSWDQVAKEFQNLLQKFFS